MFSTCTDKISNFVMLEIYLKEIRTQQMLIQMMSHEKLYKKPP